MALRSSVASEATTGMKLAALTRKQTPSPTVAISTPATAGPMTRATLTSTELRLTALRRTLGADHLEHERLARGVLEGVVETEQGRQRTDLPKADGAGDCEHAEDERLHAHGNLQARPSAGACPRGRR